MDSVDSEEFKLPILKIIVGALLAPWALRGAVVRQLGLPAVILIAASCLPCAVNTESRLIGLLFSLVNFAAYAYFAVAWHRIVILGRESVAAYGVRGWSLLETRFLWWLIVTTLVAVLVFVIIFAVFGPALSAAFRHGVGAGYATYVVMVLPVIYVICRLSLLLPSAAVGERPSLVWAWVESSGNGWRLVVLVGVLPFVLGLVQGVLERESPTFLETGLLTVLGIIVLLIGIAALSLSYKAFRSAGPGRADAADALIED